MNTTMSSSMDDDELISHFHLLRKRCEQGCSSATTIALENAMNLYTAHLKDKEIFGGKRGVKRVCMAPHVDPIMDHMKPNCWYSTGIIEKRMHQLGKEQMAGIARMLDIVKEGTGDERILNIGIELLAQWKRYIKEQQLYFVPLSQEAEYTFPVEGEVVFVEEDSC
jgi:hypothetical protein